MPRGITGEQAEEIQACLDNVVYFVQNYGYLRHTTKGKIPWDHPYPYQVEFLRALQNGEDIVVLKSRRVGASWTACAYALWLTIFHPDLTVLLLSRKEFYAKGLLRRIKFMYRNLPLWMRPKLKSDTQSEMIFEFVHGDEVAESNIISLTTTDESGRGEDAAFVMMDEAASVPNGDDVWAAIGPTASFGGQRAVVSTPNGVGGFFHRLCMQLQADQPIGFTYIEAHWKRDCLLTDEWFKKATVGLTLQKVLQEFELKFLSTGRPFFDLMKVENCYRRPSLHPEVAELMVKTKYNFSGVDTAEGHMVQEGEPDYHSISTLNEYGVQIYAFNDNRMPRAEFTGHIIKLADGTQVRVEGIPSKVHREYPGGMAIELFGTGDITIAMHETPEDQYSYMIEYRQTNSSKMRLLHSLRLAINEEAVVVTDPFTYHCLTTFEDQTMGAVEKAGAAPGGFDDPVISLALAWMLLKRHGGSVLDLSTLSMVDGRRAVALHKSGDLPISELEKALPVGYISAGPITDLTLAREGTRSQLDEFENVRSGRTRLRPPGLR